MPSLGSLTAWRALPVTGKRDSVKGTSAQFGGNDPPLRLNAFCLANFGSFPMQRCKPSLRATVGRNATTPNLKEKRHASAPNELNKLMAQIKFNKRTLPFFSCSSYSLTRPLVRSAISIQWPTANEHCALSTRPCLWLYLVRAVN